MAYDNPEGIHQALGDEELMFTVTQVVSSALSDPDGIIAKQIAEGTLTEEKLGIMAAIVAAHEMDKFYLGSLRAVGEKAIQMSQFMGPTRLAPQPPGTDNSQ